MLISLISAFIICLFWPTAEASDVSIHHLTSNQHEFVEDGEFYALASLFRAGDSEIANVSAGDWLAVITLMIGLSAVIFNIHNDILRDDIINSDS